MQRPHGRVQVFHNVSHSVEYFCSLDVFPNTILVPCSIPVQSSWLNSSVSSWEIKKALGYLIKMSDLSDIEYQAKDREFKSHLGPGSLNLSSHKYSVQKVSAAIWL